MRKVESIANTHLESIPNKAMEAPKKLISHPLGEKVPLDCLAGESNKIGGSSVLLVSFVSGM